MKKGKHILDKYEVIEEAWWFYDMKQKGHKFCPTSKKWREFYHPKTVEEIYSTLQQIIKKQSTK
tara:strand:+ start:1690 stop:1881 length:192 start_codon:yes stop_codon:yes gene_type:complete